MDKILKMRLLGDLSIECEEKSFKEGHNSSKRVIGFLEYILINRERTIPMEEIAVALWQDKYNKNPYNALKNILYRLRKVLESAGIPYSRDLIYLKNNCFLFNPNIRCQFDYEEFEECCGYALSKSFHDDEKIKSALKAINIYKDHLVANSAFREWIIPFRTYYSHLYLRLVKETISMLKNKNRYEEVINICEKSIGLFSSEEILRKEHILALCKIGENKQALDNYRKVINLYYDKFGINVSEEFSGVYREIIKNSNLYKDEVSIDLVEHALCQNDRGSDGAFACEYEVFKDIFSLERRGTNRYGRSTFLVLLSVDDEQDNPYSPVISLSMKKLQKIIAQSMRKVDVFSRINRLQYIVMMPSMTYEGSIRIVYNVLNSFRKECPKNETSIRYSIKQMEKPEDLKRRR